jgi:dUTP pyrophosphatase
VSVCRVRWLLAEGAQRPTKAHPTDAGFDVAAFGGRDVFEPRHLNDWTRVVGVTPDQLVGAHGLFPTPRSRLLFDTGVMMAMEPGWECQVRSRSGNANKYGLTVLNSPGTIDADYRGPVKVMLYNSSQNTLFIPNGTARVPEVEDEVVDAETFASLATVRGANGFGSTDKR